MTSGVDIIGSLLRADAEVVALASEAGIKAGRLPDGVGLPALLIKATSTTERQTLKRGATVRTVDRISVTVRAASYREQRLAMKLVVACCAGKTGEIAGVSGVSILTAGTGPELDGPGNSFERTQDFRVSYDAV